MHSKIDRAQTQARIIRKRVQAKSPVPREEYDNVVRHLDMALDAIEVLKDRVSELETEFKQKVEWVEELEREFRHEVHGVQEEVSNVRSDVSDLNDGGYMDKSDVEDLFEEKVANVSLTVHG
jgi:predicted  nucleic acid-binding Zn-ribbon protein